jgi:SagB-type dehydrogenase family enzyme
MQETEEMIRSAREYHRQTSYNRFDMGGGCLDWARQPIPFKTYEGLPEVPLPEVLEWPRGLLSEVLKQEPEAAENSLAFARLSEFVRLTHALTARTQYAGTDIFYRSVASAGALYPFELYVAAIAVDGLPAGLYHHNVMTQQLTLLRSGDASREVNAGLGMNEPIPLRVAFFLTSIFYRSSWKYRDRAYRYNLLDTGHLAENLSLAARALRLPCEFHFDFDDRLINSLLCLDQDREVCLAIALVPAIEAPSNRSAEPLSDPPEDLGCRSRMAIREVNHELIQVVHSLSERIVSTPDGPSPMEEHLGVQPRTGVPVTGPPSSPEVMGYAEAVFKRRSMRNFVDAKLPADQFGALLDLLCFDASDSGHGDAISVGLLTGNVEGVPPGFHLLNRRTRTLGFVKEGLFTADMADVCLGQRWLARCAVHVLFLTNLHVLEKAWGPRGYRCAMLEAGRLGQRLYVTATSMKLGCCGIGALYDGDAAQLLGLNDESALLYLVATGPVRKWSQTPE